MRVLLVVLAASLLGAPSDRYATIAVTADGNLIVTTEDGRRITPNVRLYDTDMQSVGAEQAAVAPDHQSVGWLVRFYSSPTSHPMPLKLVMLTDGRLWTISGDGPIGFWSFQDGGERVALYRAHPNGLVLLSYELWDVKSGTRVANYQCEKENDQFVCRSPQPDWVKALDAAEAKSR